MKVLGRQLVNGLLAAFHPAESRDHGTTLIVRGQSQPLCVG